MSRNYTDAIMLGGAAAVVGSLTTMFGAFAAASGYGLMTAPSTEQGAIFFLGLLLTGGATAMGAAATYSTAEASYNILTNQPF